MSKWVDRALALLVASTALVFVPSMNPAFSKPKTGVFVASAGLAAIAAWMDRRVATPIPRLPLALLVAWAAAIAVSSITNENTHPALLSSALVVVAISLQFPSIPVTTRTVTIVGAVVAVVALVQWFLGSGRRLDVFGTLGNPDFVASFLTAALPFALVSHRLGWIAAVVMLAALPACRSFATLLGLAAIVLVMFRRRPRFVLLGFGLIVLVFVTTDRRLDRPLEGRRALAAVTAPHLLDDPVTGSGPGTFVDLWRKWDVGALEPQDHAHLDAVELALELGWVGALALLALGITAASKTRGIRWDSSTAAAASIAAILVRGLVDFPLQRPADLALFAVAIGIAYNPAQPPEPT